MTDTPFQDLDLAGYRAFIKSASPGRESLAEIRARLDRRAQTHRLPDGCTVEAIEAGGVAAERLVPATARPGRTLLYLHGGGYQVGSPRSHRFAAAWLAQAGECEAIVPDYRMAPEAPYPAAVEDAVAVYRWLLSRQSPEGVVVGGDSAGAGLALALALSARARDLPQPAGLMLISPWVDLAHEGTTYAKQVGDTVSLSGLKLAAESYAHGANLRDPLISPLYADLAGLAPMRIDVGSAEALLSDSTRLAERAALADVAVSLHVLPHLVHSYPAHFLVVAAVRAALAEAGAWIGARLG
jgi:monoterpene epsilon-lactone hydrolase